MRFFKYLIFSFLFLFSSSAFSYWQYNYYQSRVFTGPTPQNVCDQIIEYVGKSKTHRETTVKENGYCQFTYFATDTQKIYAYRSDSYRPFQVLECYHPDYKILTQSINSPIKKTMCLPIDGFMCKYTSSTINNAPIVNNSITTTFNSVSRTPDPDCQEEFLNPPCDPKDPYGGCYTPPNQECTRQFDGSIVCPEDKEPPIEKGCNGADYCKRPPQGCGEGYVSGSFNGERICIKTKPSSGDGSGGGSDGGGSDGGGSDGGGSDGGGSDGGGSDGGGSDGGGSDGGGSDGGGSDGGGSDGGGSGGGLPVTPDLTGVINAIKNLTSKIEHYSKETLESIDSMSNKISGKIDNSNVHLDQIEANTLATKNNTSQTNDLLEQIKDKIGSDSGSENPPTGENPSTGDGVDLTETNGLLGEIRDGINDIKNVFSDEGKDALDQLGQASEDPRYLGALSNAESSLNTFANSLTLSSTACVSDMQIQIPIFGTVNIALSQWCSLLALLKILAHLSVLFACLRMLDSTVRAL